MRQNVCLLILVLVTITVAAAQADIPRMLHYQGIVTDDQGDPLTQTGLSLRFLIYPDSTGGTPGTALWVEVTSKDVADGELNHNLGSIVPFPVTLFTNSDTLWLEVMVDGESIDPRSRLLPSPFSLRVETIDAATGGNVDGDVNIDGHLYVEQSEAADHAGYFSISNAGNSSNAVTGFTMGTGAGGYFVNNLGGTGLIAYGDTRAIQCLSPLGTGVYAVSNSTADSTSAIHGVIEPNPGLFSAAVRGENKGSGFNNYGVWGSHEGFGIGVYGTSASGNAGYFVSDGSSAALYVRTDGSGNAGQFKGGDISVSDASGTETVEIAPSEGSTGAQIVLREADGTNGIVLDAEYVDDVNHGRIDLYRGGTRTISIEGGEATTGGQIRLRNSGGTVTIILDAELGLGGPGRVTTDELQITGGSDLSEQFDIQHVINGEQPSPGMVVCIDPQHPGELVVSSKPYDVTVAGIISGAGGIKPGMLMGQRGTVGDGQFAVALTGRVYCWVDASYGEIKPGDRLTTSATPGHAMKVTDNTRAVGAVIGKAMTTLTEGQGLVLTLVQPQ